MSKTRLRTAAVIGTGMMGPGIAATLALGGVRTTIVSRTGESAAQGLTTAHAQLRVLAENGLAEMLQVRDAVDRITASSAFDRTVEKVELVIESAPESMELKQRMFAHMDAICDKTTVLASNTSGLSITAIASRCRHPERVLTTHFWNPPHLMPLVEIVLGEKTSQPIAQAVRELLSACGKVPVVVKKDRPGQLGNRLQMALVREAAHIVAEGIADAEDVGRRGLERSTRRGAARVVANVCSGDDRAQRDQITLDEHADVLVHIVVEVGERLPKVGVVVLETGPTPHPVDVVGQQRP